jgi:large repetitive protein
MPSIISSTSTPQNGIYRNGQTLSFTIHFTEAVNVIGTPILPLMIGDRGVNATYRSGSGTESLVFEYILTPMIMTGMG